jgi:hypothetical protein
LQADERAYVINADVEDVEMTVETDDDEEEAVLDELGGECYDSSLSLLLTTTMLRRG